MLKRYGVIALSLVLVGFAVIIATPRSDVVKDKNNISVVKVSGSKEYINPGAPCNPTGTRDFFTLGRPDSENPSLPEVLKRVQYPLLLRAEGEHLITPSRIFVQPQVLKDGRIIEGFTFRYNV